MISFAVQHSGDAITVKISTPSYELNVWLRAAEIDRLRALSPSAIQAGTSAGAAAFWSCEGGEIFIGVGHDHQTWDFGVSFSVEEFQQLLDEIERARR